VTGKSTIDDLREGKRTLLVVRALSLADDRQRAQLVAALGDRTLDEASADRCRATIAATGALASVEALVAALHAEALEAIAPLPADVRRGLTVLADRVAWRDS
jgi:geranylgeranyl diphosphate synthase type I